MELQQQSPPRSTIPTVLLVLAIVSGLVLMVNTFMLIYMFFALRDVVDVVQGLGAYLLGAG